MTGEGTYQSGDDRFTLDVTASGLAEGKLTYVSESDGKMSVKGEYGAKMVELSR